MFNASQSGSFSDLQRSRLASDVGIHRVITDKGHRSSFDHSSRRSMSPKFSRPNTIVETNESTVRHSSHSTASLSSSRLSVVTTERKTSDTADDSDSRADGVSPEPNRKVSNVSEGVDSGSSRRHWSHSHLGGRLRPVPAGGGGRRICHLPAGVPACAARKG